MPDPWPLVPLGEVLRHYQEYINAPEPRSYPKLSVKLYGKGVVLDAPANGATLKMQRHQIAKAGQAILSEIWGKKGAIGLVPPDGEGALCTSHFFLFDIVRERLEPKYLQAIFAANYLEPQLNADAKGTTGYAAVRPKNLLAATIPLPPLEEQRRIVARIEALAAKVEEARGLRRQTEVETNALLRAALHRTLDTHAAKGHLGNVLLSPPRNGWSAKCDNADGGVPVLSLGAVTGFRYRSTEYKRTSQPTVPDAHYWLNPGDLLITRSNTPELVGHAAIYSGIPVPCIYPDLMMRLNIDETRTSKRFVHWWLQSGTARDYVAKTAKGTSPTMKKISQGIVLALPFPHELSLVEQRRIVADMDDLQAKTDAMKRLQAEIAAKLEALLPSILDRAFKGEL
jgi:type I restriction enzyme S subunit